MIVFQVIKEGGLCGGDLASFKLVVKIFFCE